jgi:peroxin-5
MSFMNGGAECSTSRNPLAQFTKHAGEDRSLQFDRMNAGGAGAMGSMRSDVRTISQEDQQMMERFAQSNQQQQSKAFAFDAMRHEIGNMPQGQNTANGAADFRPQQQRLSVSPSPQIAVSRDAVQSGWAGEFSRASPGIQEVPVTSSYASMSNMPRFAGAGYTPMYSQTQPVQQMPTSSKIVELDQERWEEHFQKIELDAKEKGKEKAKEEKLDEVVEDPTVGDFTDDHFENIWDRIKSEVLDNVDDWTTREGAAWDRDFDEFTVSRPEFGDYQFEESNSYLQEDDPYALGVELMDNGSNLSQAALCFEAAVKRNPEHIEAWSRLGAAQAQNEKEDPAIRALERCVKLDPSNLTALLNLSVSYTNEGYENAAYATLEKWLATKYPAIADKARQQEPRLENEDRFQLHGRVTELFIRAAQLSPDGANIDADVQVGLGVLFYGNEEYSKAIDCFNAALAVRPNDPLLWNRLGATLANSNRSEEAIDAYYRALELRPSFVRARYNLGVSCINIGCYKEAAQHLLSALSLHKMDGPEDDILANQSTNLYETLRRVFLAIERRDLVEKVGSGMDVNQFRSEFDF